MNVQLSLRLLLCLGLLLSPLANPACAQEFPKHIDVTGTADVKIAPDEVVITLSIEATHKNIREAIKENDARLKKLIAVLEKQGIEPKHIQTSLVRVTLNYEESQHQYGKGGKFQAQQQAPNAPNPAPNTPSDPFGEAPAGEDGERKIKDYTAGKTVVIYSKDLTKLEQVLVSIYESGVAKVGNTEFQYSGAKRLRDTLRIKAIQAAKEKAEQLTGAIGQKIGKAVRIEEPRGGGRDNPFDDPFGPSPRSSYRHADTTGGPTGIAPELITVGASVTVWFELP